MEARTLAPRVSEHVTTHRLALALMFGEVPTAVARLALCVRTQRRIGATQSEPEAPETAPLEAAPAEMAVPPQNPVPSSGPSPAARPAGPSTYDYIEPPPAAR